MKYNVACIPGDGIGPEIVAEAKKVLNKIAEKYGHEFDYTEILMGGCSIDAYGVPLTEEAVNTAKASDAKTLYDYGRGRTPAGGWLQDKAALQYRPPYRRFRTVQSLHLPNH